jgi:formyltetrahydrofolate-dependent phosphoribosylglycinamide formyltransferase
VIKLAVLLSGSGSTLQNIMDRIDQNTLQATVACVVSSRHGVYGLERARLKGIPAHTVARKDYQDVQAFGAAIWDTLIPYAPDLVVLAGFMSLLPIPADYQNRVMNVHPALIPAFCGKGMFGHHVHEAVLAAGVKVTGATVHFVDEHYDHGPIIMQGCVPVLDDDTPDTLAERVQAKERELYPQAIQLYADGKLEVVGDRTRLVR